MEDMHSIAKEAVTGLHNASMLAPVNLEAHKDAARDAQYLGTYIGAAEKIAEEHQKAGKEIERLNGEVRRLELKLLEKEGGAS